MNAANRWVMSGWSLYVGRVRGVAVRLHWSFLLWVAFTLLFLVPLGDLASTLLFNGVLFGSVFLHELGHCVGARLSGGSAHEILLHPLGGFSRIRTPQRPRAELVSVGAGPAVNLLLGGVLGLVLLGGALREVAAGGDPFPALLARLQAAQEASVLALLVALVVGINTALFLFNVLPAYPMDGGRILRALLWPLLGWRRATLGATAVGVLMGAAFVALGFGATQLFVALIGAYVIYTSGSELLRTWRGGGPRFHRDDALPAEREDAPDRDDDLMPFERRR